MKPAYMLFEETLEWLLGCYSSFHFYAERDVVWTVQTHIGKLIRESKLTYKVFNDYPMLPGNRRHWSADLAILNDVDVVEVAIEFKYEPSHKRGGADILKEKLPVVDWKEVGNDIERIHKYIDRGWARKAFSVFIDEGGFFCYRPAHPRSEWVAWKNDVDVWLSRAFAGHGT
jgi:hypothetical protein